MSERSMFSVQVPIPVLRKVHPTIDRISPEAAQTLKAECVLCGAHLNGPELKLLAEGSNLNEALERVRLEYCLRRSCESRFYRVTLDGSTPGLKTVMQSFEMNLAGEETRPAGVVSLARIVQVAGCMLALGYALFVLHHLYYGERIPLIQQVHNYSR